MTFWRRTFFVLCALALGAVRAPAADVGKEQRAYTAAAMAFQNKLWNRAETQFGQLVQRYPTSTNVPQAVLLQAQAQFEQKKFRQAAALLAAHKAAAGNLADQYVYWMGESQLAAGNVQEGIATLNSIGQNFPASPLGLRANVEAAAALGRIGDWPGVIASLEGTNSVFPHEAATSTNELVVRGRLLRAQARFESRDFNGAAADLETLNSQPLAPELSWQAAYLFCRTKMAVGDWNGALVITTNLLQMTGREPGLRAESVALRGELFERLGLPDAAMAVYRENLATNTPVLRRRQAVLRIAGLAVAQNEFAGAEQLLGDFLQQYSNSPPAEVALLTLGELYLKDASLTNHLSAAQARLDQFLARFANTPLAGRAYLDRGWCAWLSGRVPDSLNDFRSAAQRLPLSEDLAVAQFKIGDALFAQKDYAGALKYYRLVLNDYTNFPAVEKSLGDRALYQSLRANLEVNDLAGANDSLAQMLQRFPSSELAPNSALLYGEGLADSHRPAEARETFRRFEKEFPTSPWWPQAEFAIARTYELERNWTNAIAGYEKWLDDFPTNVLRPQAVYALAWANFQAGNETNALAQFGDFITQYPTNDLAPQAQWWLADHYFSAGEFAAAEKNYDLVNQHFPGNELAYPALLMAGRSAMGRQGYPEAIRDYFTPLEEDTNCPPDLRLQALFAHGEALMRSDTVDTNNPLANFQLGAKVFGRIVQANPTNQTAALAWFYIGECNVQFANYDAATNAYGQAAASAAADVATRSKAQIGRGIALEKKAARAAGDDQKALLQSALNDYLDVFDTSFGKNLRDGETADAFWVKKAGLQALPLMQALNIAPTDDFIAEMERLLPQLTESLEKKRAEFSAIKK